MSAAGRVARLRQARRRLGAVAVRRLSQLAALALFLYLFLAAVGPAPVALVPVDLFLRLDPLLGLGTTLAARAAAAYLLWALPLALVAVVAGRFFCGWLCPLGATLDLVAPGSAKRAHARPPADGLRAVKYVLLAASLGGVLVAGTAWLLLDPLVLLTRSLATALYPLFVLAVTALQTTLYGAGVAPDLWLWLDAAWRGSVLPYYQPYYRLAALFLALFALVLAGNRLAPRFWCRYLCPLGAFFALLGRWAPVRRRVNKACNRCGRCAAECAMGAVDAKTFAADPGECILCLRCREVCPRGAVEYGPAPGLARHDPSRRQLLLGLAGGAVALGTLRTGASAAGQDVWLVRPPGAVEGFLARCVRCGQCMKVCPTGGLQPSLLEAGLEGLWSPVLVPRLGFCDFSCTACGHACPTGAIAPLDLADKRQRVIGVAYLDEQRCLPYADLTPCIICQEMCPVPDKAIVLSEETVVKSSGEQVTLKRPHVERERCIGCGICEYYCPLPNEAAIRVRATGPLAERHSR